MAMISMIMLALSASLALIQPHQWTLTECIDYAVENNLSIRQRSLNVEKGEIAVNTALNSRLPGVSASVGESISFGRGLGDDNVYTNTNGSQTSFSVGADVPVFNGFQIKNNIELSKLDLKAATEELAKAKDDIRVAVAQAYVQILYDMEILDVAESQVNIDSLQVERLQEMARNGKASRAEVSAQEATLAQSRVSLTQASTNLSLAILDLTQLLELPTPEGFSVVRPSEAALQAGVLMDPDEIYAQAVTFKPQIKAEDIRLDYALKNVDIAKGARLPSLSMSGGIGTNYYKASAYKAPSFYDQLSNKFSQYVNLSLNIPIFSRMSTRNQIRTAQLNVRNQEIQLESAKKQLYQEIQKAYYNAVAAQDKFRSSGVAAQSARDAFDLVQAKYETGKTGITEFNEAKARLMSAESDLVQARYSYLYQSRLLDFYRGKDLVF